MTNTQTFVTPELAVLFGNFEFDCAYKLTATPDGTLTVTDADDYVPSVYVEGNDENTGEPFVEDSHWDFASNGMTGQYGYNGPIMHASEMMPTKFFVEAAADALDGENVIFAVVAVEVLDDKEDSEPAGWAIVRKFDA